MVCSFLKKEINHCVKSVQIRSYFWSAFSCIRTNTEIYGVNGNNSVFWHFSLLEWDKVFNNGSVKIYGRQSLKKTDRLSSINLSWSIFEYLVPNRVKYYKLEASVPPIFTDVCVINHSKNCLVFSLTSLRGKFILTR